MIRFRGWEKSVTQYNVGMIIEDNEVVYEGETIEDGGVMWESDKNLHFSHPEGMLICDLINSPFNYEDLMLGIELADKWFFEDDIVKWRNGITGRVIQGHLGWFVEQQDQQDKYYLNDANADELEIIGNSYTLDGWIKKSGG